MTKRVFVLLAGVSLLLAIAPSAGAADDGEQIFQANCAACHQPDGAGIPGAFPPLAGNPAVQDAAHLRSVLAEGLTGPLDVLGQTYNGTMPAFPQLTPDQVDALIAFLQTDLQGAAPTTTQPAAVEGSAERGEALFTGARRLENGGPACIACHSAGTHTNLGGSTFGPDLTDLNTRFGGNDGVFNVLANPPSPTMQPTFGPNPFTDEERADLAAFFASVQPGEEGVDLLLIIGLIGVVVLFGAMLVFGGSRQNYVDRLRSGK